MVKSERFINWDANATYGPLGVSGVDSFTSSSSSCERYNWLNPSSLHSGGQRSRAMMENIRAKILARVQASLSGQLIFTSGATEANNLVLWSWALRHNFNCRIIIPASEHASILEPTRMLSSLGVEVQAVNPAPGGSLNAEIFLNAVSNSENSKPILLACMLANNETGQIYPVADIAYQVKQMSPNCWFHADAVQAFNKLELDFNQLGVNSLSFSGHKLGALPGVGGVIYRKGDEIMGINSGGAQEGRVRAGTENWWAIASLDAAVERKDWSVTASAKHMLKMLLTDAVPDIQFKFERDNPEKILPNTLSATVPGVIADDLVVSADLHGLLISAGAACASGKPEPSHVLLAAGLSESEAMATVRISFRSDISAEEVERGAAILVNCIKRMRA